MVKPPRRALLTRQILRLIADGGFSAAELESIEQQAAIAAQRVTSRAGEEIRAQARVLVGDDSLLTVGVGADLVEIEFLPVCPLGMPAVIWSARRLSALQLTRRLPLVEAALHHAEPHGRPTLRMAAVQ